MGSRGRTELVSAVERVLNGLGKQRWSPRPDQAASSNVLDDTGHAADVERSNSQSAQSGFNGNARDAFGATRQYQGVSRGVNGGDILNRSQQGNAVPEAG